MATMSNLDRFADVAQEFCSVVESTTYTDRTDFLVKIYRILPRLIGEAIELPAVSLTDEDKEPSEPITHKPNDRPTYAQWEQLYNLLKEKLGDWDGYMQVFDPTTDKEAVCGSIADDIADIYRDLKEGLILKEMHQAPPEQIIWKWR
jgi:hypothetical protein